MEWECKGEGKFMQWLAKMSGKMVTEYFDLSGASK